MKKILFLFLFLFVSVFSQSKKNIIVDSFDIKFKKVLEYQNDSDLLELGRSLIDKDKRIAARAAIALANIKDTLTTNLIMRVYKESDINARKDIAFSLGQIGPCFETGYFLLSELKNCTDIALRSVLFEAIGNVGYKELLDSILSIIPINTDDEISKIMGVTRFALRGIKNQQSISYLVDCIKSSDQKVFSSASYALWRSSNFELIKDHLQTIYNVLQQSNSENKYYLINALSSVPSNDTLKMIILNCLNDSRNIQLSVIKTLEKIPLSKEEFEKISFFSESKDEHIRLSYYRFLSKIRFIDSLDKKIVLEKINDYLINKTLTWREKAELYNSLAFYQKDLILEILIKEINSKNERYNAKIINAIGEIGTPLALDALLYKINPSNTFTNIALLEALSKIRTKVKIDSLNLNRVKEILKKSFASKNIAIITTAVMLSNNNDFRNLFSFKEYLNIYNSLKLPDDVEGILEFLKLFAFIGGDDAIKILEKEVNSESDIVSKTARIYLEEITGEEYFRSDYVKGGKNKFIYSWSYFDKIKKSPKLEINTEKGKILVELYPNEAPFTVMSICSLADKKFFDGLVFHRVVPNFVIQGGDPLGTGWGGPGYSIKTEISPIKFEKGTLGMANAGKNTEGSQFFITHSPQPNLDGRYTAFGKVIKGMDVVDLIQEGDKIISIRRIK